MIGTIWNYDHVTEDGYIVGQDNQRYRFSKKDCTARGELKEGDAVDFKIEGRWAKEIILMAAASNNM